MKTAFTAALLLLAGCSGPGDPASSLVSFFDAVKSGKGSQAVAYLSQDALDSLEAGMNLAELKHNPDSSSAALATYGVTMTPEDVSAITIDTLLERMIESPLFMSMMEEASIEVGDVSVVGSKAMVNATVVFIGDTTSGTVEMVLEEDNWKITGEGLRFAL
ncbi:MAG: hypothetical protein R6V62_04920 [Candidatus Fermentibacteraceae bacterium]